MIEPIDKAELKRAQEELRKEIPPVPPPINLEQVGNLSGLLPLNYRGKKYWAVPIPFPMSVKLQLHMRNLDALKSTKLSPATQPVIKQLLDEMARDLGSLLVPDGVAPWLAKVTYRLRLRPNPLRNAQEGDLGWLLAFFLRRRMIPTVMEL